MIQDQVDQCNITLSNGHYFLLLMLVQCKILYLTWNNFLHMHCLHKSDVDSLILLFQALYFCIPFREQLLEYYANNKTPGDAEENLLTCLADLFMQVTCR
jgi:hypothetical protein